MIELGAAARLLVAGWCLVAATALLGVLGGLGWLAVTGTTSASCAAVEVEPVLAEGVSRDAPVRRFVLMDNELAVLESELVRARAAEQTGFPVTATSLTASVPRNTEVLRFCYRDRSAARAQEGARAVGDAYRQVRSEAVAQDLRTRVDAATAERQRLAADLAQVASSDIPEQLTKRLEVLEDRLLLLRAVDTDGSRVLQEAQPARADSQDRRLVLVAGTGLGLLLGCWAALRRPQRTS